MQQHAGWLAGWPARAANWILRSAIMQRTIFATTTTTTTATSDLARRLECDKYPSVPVSQL